MKSNVFWRHFQRNIYMVGNDIVKITKTGETLAKSHFWIICPKKVYMNDVCLTIFVNWHTGGTLINIRMQDISGMNVAIQMWRKTNLKCTWKQVKKCCFMWRMLASKRWFGKHVRETQIHIVSQIIQQSCRFR